MATDVFIGVSSMPHAIRYSNSGEEIRASQTWREANVDSFARAGILFAGDFRYDTMQSWRCTAINSKLFHDRGGLCEKWFRTRGLRASAYLFLAFSSFRPIMRAKRFRK